MNRFNVVALQDDLPETNRKWGQVGTIVELW
jgi:hypothetical protein